VPSKSPGRLHGSKRIYLVIAASGRAIAQALKAIGNTVAVVDGFADMDTRAVAEVCKKVSRTKFGLDTRGVLQAVHQLQDKYEFQGLLYDAAMESSPDLLDSVSVVDVIGNSSHTLRKCKDPETFFSTLNQHEIPHPEISFERPENPADSWLIKHVMGTGGSGVSDISEEFDTEENVYFQRKIDGINFSLTFLANGSEIKPLGFNQLWVESLGKNMPYIYTGAINYVSLTQHQQSMTINYATVLAREFKLVGLNSMDCILSDDSVYAIEVNPRIPATYELYETRRGDLLKEHIEACKTHVLTPSQKKQLLRGHAIVYAPDFVQIPESFTWPLWTADRPHSGEEIDVHQPICSVFAGGRNAAQVREIIRTRKNVIINKLTHARDNHYQ